MDLKNGDDEWFGCRGMAWGMTLTLAREFGWKPAGTLPPLDENGHEPQGVALIAVVQPARAVSWARFYAKKLFGKVNDFWDQTNYYTNDGQRVTDEDAKALAEVLCIARDQIVGTPVQQQYIPDPDEALTPFIVYFRKGGFEIH